MFELCRVEKKPIGIMRSRLYSILAKISKQTSWEKLGSQEGRASTGQAGLKLVRFSSKRIQKGSKFCFAAKTSDLNGKNSADAKQLSLKCCLLTRKLQLMPSKKAFIWNSSGTSFCLACFRILINAGGDQKENGWLMLLLRHIFWQKNAKHAWHFWSVARLYKIDFVNE